jgi:hypothetical protein
LRVPQAPLAKYYKRTFLYFPLTLTSPPFGGEGNKKREVLCEPYPSIYQGLKRGSDVIKKQFLIAIPWDLPYSLYLSTAYVPLVI